ncbi:MAG: cation diffusion facilitator family transporter [Rhodospirillales bacterium]|nr:cation diffusion facilitator family transporter [Rhodospirillales bacterium]
MEGISAVPGSSTSNAGAGAARAHRLKTIAAVASVLVAVGLIGAKGLAYAVTDSVSLLSTLIDSMLDFAASLINLIAIRQAGVPADREHRFGHGKAEPLAGLGQAAFVAGSAVFVLIEAVGRLTHPAPIGNETIGIAVMLLSIVVTLALVLYQRWVIRKTSSVAIGADALHYKSDLLVNSGVIAALLASTHLGWTLADPLFAIAVAAYIVWSAWGIFQSSFNLLMDRELPEADRARIRAIAVSHPSVVNVHDLRTRSSGTQAFIQFHLELDGNLTLIDAHVIADAVMRDVERAFPNAEVLIHEDPCGVAEPRRAFD